MWFLFNIYAEKKETGYNEVYPIILKTYVPKWMLEKQFEEPILLADGASRHR